MITILLRVLHLLAVSVWVGYPLGASGDIRRTIGLGPPHTTALIPRIDRAARITIASGVLAAATGLGLVFSLGGFGAVPVRIHIGMTLTLVTLALGGVLTHPAWIRAREAIGKGDLSAAGAAAKRFAMGDGIEHLLKFSVLAIMVWKA